MTNNASENGATNVEPILYRRPVSPIVDYGLEQINPSRSEHSLDELWCTLWRRKFQIAAVTVLGLIAGFASAILMTPVYRAETALELEGLNDNYLNLRDLNPTEPATSYGADTYLQTQAKIIRSESLAGRVSRKLSLASQAQFTNRPSPGIIAKLLHKRPPPSDSPNVIEERIVKRLLQGLNVQTSLQSRIIAVAYDSRDPVLAANVANAFADEYINDSLETRSAAMRRTADWLSKQIASMKDRLEKQTNEAEQYTRSAGLIVTSNSDNLSEARLLELQTELSRAQGALADKQSEYETALSTPAESMPQVLDSGTLRDYRASLGNLRRELAELSASYTPEHYKVQKVMAQIAEVEHALAQERTNVINRIQEEYRAAARRQQLLMKAYSTQADLVAQQTAHAARYGVMKRELQTEQQLYDTMLQKTLETNVAIALTSSNVRVVDPAHVPTEPYSPKTPLNAAVGLLGGFVVGIGVSIGRQRSDRTLKRPGEMTALLNLRELGVIPSAALEPTNGQRKRLLGTEAPSRTSVDLATWRHSASAFSESFRSAATSLLFSSSNSDHPHAIVITSLASGEGKTTVLTNLGIALTEANRRTLLIDGDLRRPRLHGIFGFCNTQGLSDLLSGEQAIHEIPINAIAKETEIPGLSILLSGPGPVSVTKLFHSKRIFALLARLRKEFDYVLIDSPPSLQFPDARILGRWCDGVVLVVRAGRTRREEIEFARTQFVADRVPVVGTILNDWTPDSMTGRYYRFPTSGYGDYDS